MNALHTLGLSEALNLLAKGEISALELTRAHLARIEAVDGRVRAFLAVGAEQALDAAKRADADRRAGRAGLLCGAPLGLKDLLCTRDLPTTCGSRMLENFVRRQIGRASELEPIANSSMACLPKMTAPACRSFSTTVAL